MEYTLATLLGVVLLVMCLLICIALAKYIFGSSPKDKKPREQVYMLHIDEAGQMKIRKYRGKMNNWQDYGK